LLVTGREEELDEESSTPQETLQDSLAKNWDQLEAREFGEEAAPKPEEGSFVEELYKPYADQLKQAHLTPREWARASHYINQALWHSPAELGAAIQDAKEGYGEDPVRAIILQAKADQQAVETRNSMERDWQSFAKENPDAQRLRRAMGQELLANEQRPGESVKQALARAYRAVLERGQKADAAIKPGQRWSSGLNAAYDELESWGS
jgi:hypothetical protein